ncbi:MAG: type I DNA topoisomerase [Gammaproteobacteria bacterium]|nr:type I DNA topoisomerase [Gammaproteobacteria bacterium]
MTRSLVIVESPAKAKTIKKYLGKDFEVLASYGHVRDLVPKEGAVDPDNDFAMNYQLIEKNTKHVDAIIKALKSADNLYLATDPDREGEAISWHLAQIISQKRGLKDKVIKRVVFHEITKKAVNDAVANPRDILMPLVNAQQARRSLDYLVGFNLSPLLWRKIRRGLSAGRVQSPALRLIVEREVEIESFIQQEYWSILAECYDQDSPEKIYNAKLIKLAGAKVEQFSITDKTTANTAVDNLTKLSKQALKQALKVEKVETKQRKRNPAPPFTTSTLQQEASRKLGFGAQKTMRVAQQLYEGIEIGEGTTGLITYMRTDSVTLSQDALTEIRSCIVEHYGEKNCPDEPRYFKNKSKNAQEAHEAIRPTACSRAPKDLRAYLSNEQFRLYELIWKRTMACQMINAVINTVAVELSCGDTQNLFKANGSTIIVPGFLSLYQEGIDDQNPEDGEGRFLPILKEGDTVPINKIFGKQHFTEPPPRYGEASLIKTLEEYGIGRPSTYASIISTLQNREYVILENKKFYPTDVGRVVNKFLTSYFGTYVDYEFTAGLEDQLDAVARGEIEWVPLLREFWTPFKKLTVDINDTVKRSDVTQEKIDENCPKCNNTLSIRLGRSGRFIGCDGFPECDYTRSLEETKDEAAEQKVDHDCPTCNKPLVIKHGRYGKFIGCSGYPDCKHIEPLEKPESTNVTCPKCGKGTILKRKSRRGKIFFSCEKYPKCDYATWDEPLNEPCPQCNWPILTKKITKRSGTNKVCPQQDCNYKQAMESEELESGSESGSEGEK